MTDTLPPPPPLLLPQRSFMSSQSGNIQDLAAYSGNLPSFIVGSDAEPNSSPRHEFVHHSPSSLDMGLRFVNIPSEDARFSPGSAASRSPLYAVETNISTSPSTSFSHYPHVFPTGMTGSAAYLNNSPSFYSQNPPIYCTPETKPPLPSFVIPTSMAPPHRSSHLPQLGSSGSTRDLYTSATPQLRRPDLSSRSPSAVGNLRAIPLSPSSSSGFMSPANNMESQMANATPPLGGTEVLSPLQTSDGQQIRPDIHAKIDKGFFLEGEWTCYRRNYFSLSCSYAITPHPPMATVHLQHNGSTLQVYAFAMSIAAVVDGRDGKPIELVQHTPKRDKGPQNQPDRVTLAPRPPLTMYSNVSEGGLGTASRAVFDGSYPPGTPNQPQTETTFERIQFKQATANNGKRRAAQQYYHLLVELYADVGPQMGAGRWIKIAQRVSCQIVVRGRSPGHYQSERRGSNTSAGPSGSGGKGAGPGSYSSGGNFGRSSGDQSGLSGSMLPGGGYGGGYDVRSHPYLPTSSCMTQMGNPLSPLLSGDEIKQIEEPAGYTYNPYTLYENANGMRLPTATPNYREERAQSYYQLPSLPSHMPSPKIKQEHFSLPALPSGAPNCGRWEGVSVSRGYIPSTFSRNEVNTS